MKATMTAPSNPATNIGSTLTPEQQQDLFNAATPELSKNKRSVLRREVRAYCKARDIRGIDLHRESGISHAAASKLLSNPSAKAHTKSINNKTAYKLDKWLVARNTAEAPAEPTEPTTPAEPARDEVLAKLEAEVVWKDKRIKLYENELENKAGIIMKLQAELEHMVSANDEAMDLGELQKIKRTNVALRNALNALLPLVAE